VHVAHTQDDTYDIDEVKAEIDQLENAGFDVTFVERPGNHYDDSDNDSGTDHDIQTYLLPHMADPWLAPA
jgi:hypothetical protein